LAEKSTTALILGIFVVGLGHIYMKHARRGAMILVAGFFIGFALGYFIGIWGVIPGIGYWSWQLYDLRKLVKKSLVSAKFNYKYLVVPVALVVLFSVVPVRLIAQSTLGYDNGPLTPPQPPFDPQLCRDEPDYFTPDCRPIPPSSDNNNDNDKKPHDICFIKPWLPECKPQPFDPNSNQPYLDPYDPCGARGSDLACINYVYTVFSIPVRIIICSFLPIPFFCP